MAEELDDEDLMPEDSIAKTLSWIKWVLAVEASQRTQEEESLAFQDASESWPQEVKAMRGAATVAGVPIPARPMISVATLDEPVALVESFERQANLAPRIHALSEDADDDTAETLAGLYRCIERDSRAQLARRWAYQRTVWAGRGCYRVDKVYDPDGGHPLDQKIVIKRVLYQGDAIFDPSAQEPDWSDGLKAVLLYDLPAPTYKRKYGTSKLARASAEQINELSTAENTESWIRAGEGDENTRVYRVAEEWTVEIEHVKQVLLDDNELSDADDIPEGKKKHPTDKRSIPDREVRKVFWRVINAVEELEAKQEWDGQYIPLIPAIGRELQPVRGVRRWFGMVHNAKGAVRLTNYAASGAVEMAALEPKAPFTAAEGVTEDYKEEYQQANIRNIPVLHYKPTDSSGQRADPPHRVQVDMGRMGPNMSLLQMGQGFVQSATATHPPSLGQDTPAFRSGKAINALKTQSTQSNSPYLENLADISMSYEAKVILDLIPKVYDRPGRIARCLGIDGKTTPVALNHPFQPGPTGRPQLMPYDTPEQQQTTDMMVADPNHPAKHYDLTKGRYGVEVTIGKSYADERQEGLSEMGVILQADPQMMQIVGPEYFRYRGEKWAEQVADLLQKNRDHVAPWLSSTPQQQPSAQQLQQLQAENQQLKAQMQQFAMEKAGKVIEQQGKAAIVQTQENAETQRAREANETKIAVAELSAKVERLSLFLDERARLGSQAHEVASSAADAAMEQQASAQEHQQAMAQQQAGAMQGAAASEQEHAQGMEAAQNQPVDSGSGGADNSGQ
jgi:hypothetical protein